MKSTTRLLIVALGAAIVFGACNDSDNGGGNGTAGGGTAAGGGGGTSTGGGGGSDAGTDAGTVNDGGIDVDGGVFMLTEAQAAAALGALNAGEIEVAQSVLEGLVDNQARQFAQEMITEHGAVQSQANTLMTQRGITPQPNAVSKVLAEETAQTIALLSDLSGRELDLAYLQSQVAMHQQALALIDCMVLPAIEDQMLQAFVTETVRPGVEKHLTAAAAVLASLGGGDLRGVISTEPQCDLTCVPNGAGGLFPDRVRIVACPP